MLIDEAAALLAAAGGATKAVESPDGLLLPAGVGRGVLLPRTGRSQAAPAHELAVAFLSLLPRAGVIALENLPAREGTDGVLTVPSVPPPAVASSRGFWDATGGQPAWLEARLGSVRRGWLCSYAPGRLRVFEAHLREGASVLSLVPYGVDVEWSGDGTARRGPYDPLGVFDSYARLEALLGGGEAEAGRGIVDSLTREVDLVLLASAAIAAGRASIEDVASRPGQVGKWRRVARLRADS